MSWRFEAFDRSYGHARACSVVSGTAFALAFAGFVLDVAGGAVLLLGFHIADEIVRRASLLAHGKVLTGKCGPMGRYSRSTAVPLMPPQLQPVLEPGRHLAFAANAGSFAILAAMRRAVVDRSRDEKPLCRGRRSGRSGSVNCGRCVYACQALTGHPAVVDAVVTFDRSDLAHRSPAHH